MCSTRARSRYRGWGGSDAGPHARCSHGALPDGVTEGPLRLHEMRRDSRVAPPSASQRLAPVSPPRSVLVRDFVGCCGGQHPLTHGGRRLATVVVVAAAQLRTLAARGAAARRPSRRQRECGRRGHFGRAARGRLLFGCCEAGTSSAPDAVHLWTAAIAEYLRGAIAWHLGNGKGRSFGVLAPDAVAFRAQVIAEYLRGAPCEPRGIGKGRRAGRGRAFPRGGGCARFCGPWRLRHGLCARRCGACLSAAVAPYQPFGTY